jgi:hypothetical protein
MNALIGYTGFVGGTLMRQGSFDALFNSSNIEEIRGRRFDRVVCAGVSAVKWLANKEPEKDLAGINRLMSCLAEVEADHFVLTSTIDVYQETAGRTELDIPSTDGLHPYGLHRLMLESFIVKHFPSSTIIRLPALFGTGLKKNALYDLIHLNAPDKIIANGSFQWYPTRRLTRDFDAIVHAGIGLINLTSEPVEMSAIQARFFPDVAIGGSVPLPPRYDLRSVHNEVLGGRLGYHLTAGDVFDEMSSFIAQERRT